MLSNDNEGFSVTTQISPYLKTLHDEHKMNLRTF